MADAKEKDKKAANVIATIIVILILMFVFKSCSEDNKKAEAHKTSPSYDVQVKSGIDKVQARFNSVNGYIKEAKYYDISSNLDITVAIDDEMTGYQLINAAGVISRDVGKVFQANAEFFKAAKFVNVTFFTPETDNLGNLTNTKYLHLEFEPENLIRANYENLTAAKMLNLANPDSIQVRGKGWAGVESWCIGDGAESRGLCEIEAERQAGIKRMNDNRNGK